MAKAHSAAKSAFEDEYAEVEAWYRHELSQPAPPPETYLYPPITIGPSWQRTETGTYSLPKWTLGWQALAWAGVWLKDAESDEPWQFTLEQARIILWWYAVDEDGRFLFDDAVIQRLKGWGKDPLGAALCLIEAFGPCRFSHFDSEGNPVGKECENAWVQTCGVAIDQTKNTMKLFPGMVSKAARAHYGISVGKTIIYGLGDTRTIEAITSSPTKLEGARGSFVLLNETHHWQSNNDGLAMADVIERNAAKSKGGAARTMRITNAPEPSLDSVGLRDRMAYELIAEGDSVGGSRIMYDSLEAPPEAPLTWEAAPHVLRAVRGDSWWLDIDRIVGSIFDPRNPPSRSRRFWYNQLVASEEAWIVPQDFDSLARKDIVVSPKDEVVIFFDGSKSDDATALMGCRVSDGHSFTLGMWQRPPGERGKGWIVPRYAVDQRVDEVFATYNVVGFWGDPSHTLEDETQERYWDSFFDDWHRKYKDRLRLWAQPNKHAVMWDMTSPLRVAEFTAAAERCAHEVEAAAAALRGEAAAIPFTHDGDGRLRRHVHNAQRYPNKWGVSIWKGHRESKKKIDLAVCMIGARMLRRALLNAEEAPKRKGGKVWW